MAPCQPAKHLYEMFWVWVWGGGGGGGQSSGARTIALGFQPLQQVLGGLQRERGKQAPHRCKIWTGSEPTNTGFPAWVWREETPQKVLQNMLSPEIDTESPFRSGK